MAQRLLPRTARFAYRVARHVPRWAWPPQARFAYRVVRIAPHVVPHVPGVAPHLPGTARRHGADLRLAGPYPTEPEDADRRFPLPGILPLWVVPAAADWWLRRRTHVERTTGTQESAAHALMVAEAGVPLVMGLVTRINPLVLTVMTGAAVAQGATAVYDASLATGARETRPVEQCLHNLLNVLPLTTLALTASLHPDQVRALLHGGPGSHDWRLLSKEPPLPAPCLVALGTVVTAGVVLPYAEELWRCRRAARAREE
ncbi:diguanylate cyclase [Streptomyces sp. NPDC003688]